MCGAQIQCTQTERQTEIQLRELRAMVLELRGQLTVTQNELENTKTLLNKMEPDVKKEITEKPKVAFSAGLTSHFY